MLLAARYPLLAYCWLIYPPYCVVLAPPPSPLPSLIPHPFTFNHLPLSGPVAFATLLALWVHLCWKMRMKSTPPLLLQQASWKDYLCIALINLTPRGYQPFPHGSTLAAEDGNNNAGRDEREREEEGINNEFAREYAALPPMSWEEKVILADFVAIALLWFFRDPKGERRRRAEIGRMDGWMGVDRYGWVGRARHCHPPTINPNPLNHPHPHSHNIDRLQATPGGPPSSPSRATSRTAPSP